MEIMKWRLEKIKQQYNYYIIKRGIIKRGSGDVCSSYCQYNPYQSYNESNCDVFVVSHEIKLPILQFLVTNYRKSPTELLKQSIKFDTSMLKLTDKNIS